MEKPLFDRTLNKILIEVSLLEQKALLDLQTAKFLEHERKKQDKVVADLLSNPNSTEEQIDDAIAKLYATIQRISYEYAQPETKAGEIENELNMLLSEGYAE